MVSRTRATEEASPTLSVVFPVFNEQDNLRPLYHQVNAALVGASIGYELIFVDNGSYDRSLEIIKALAEQDYRVCFVSLSRNFGYQGGLIAGMSYARGEAIITMDADLQHPPALLPKMVGLWRKGFEVVYTTKYNYHLSGWRYYQVKIFYRVISKISGVNLSFGQSDFRLLDRKVVDTILSVEEYRKFLRGMVDWVGFRQVAVEYEVADRLSGESKFSYTSLMSFALDGIFSFSSLPLRWILFAGIILASLSFLYTLFALALGVSVVLGFSDVAPPGWATLAVTVTLFGGTHLIAIGILGEYIGRIYEQVKRRPEFIVRETSDSGLVRVPERHGD